LAFEAAAHGFQAATAAHAGAQYASARQQDFNLLRELAFERGWTDHDKVSLDLASRAHD
jgi:hypothetical protein